MQIFEVFCSSSVENAIGDLRGIALRVRVALGGMALLPVLILPGQEHGLAFHRFVSSLVASSSALWFSESRSLCLWVGLFLDISFISRHCSVGWFP